MIEQEITVRNRAGLHARPSAQIVETVKNFDCSIHIEKGDNRINAKSILGVMTLGAAWGTVLKLVAEGNDERLAIDALVRLFESKFDEEEM